MHGDLLISRANTRDLVGAPVLVEGDHPHLLLSDKILRLIPDDARVDRRYLARALRSVAARKHFESRAGGTSGSMTNVTQDDIRSAPLPLPPLVDQRRMADILDKADTIRRKRKEAIALAEELLRSVFLEMFGDPVTNPKGWPVEPLGRYLGFVTSGSRGWAEHYADRGDRFIRSLDVQMDAISDKDAAFVVAPHGAEAERTRVQENDVLLTITGSKIGRAARATQGHAGAFVSQHVAILRVLPGLDADVLTAFLVNDRGGQALIARSQYGQTKPGLNLSQLRAFPIPIPPGHVQQRIRGVRNRLRLAQERLELGFQASEDLFVSLVQRAFSGGAVS
ncbi:restriction endonuclease subunit S (plasmid) [Sorangium sp. So ce119]